MSLSIPNLNKSLKTALNETGEPLVTSAATKAKELNDSFIKSPSAVVGDVKSGIKVVSEDPINSGAATKEPVVGKITENLSGINVIESSSQSSSISTLTGKTATNGLLKSVTTSISPRAVKSTLKNTTSASSSEINKFIENVSTDPTNVSSASLLNESPQGISKDFLSSVSEQRGQFANLIGNPTDLLKTPTGLLNQPFNQLANFIGKQLGFDPLKNLGREVSNLFDTDAQVYLGGGLRVTDKFDTNLDNPRKFIDEFGVSNVSDQVDGSPNIGSNVKISSIPEVVGEVGEFNGVDTPDSYKFTFVETAEELALEFKNAKREFSFVFMNPSYDYTDTMATAEKAMRFSKRTGSLNEITSGGLLWHYFFRKDGNLQRGKPLDVDTNVTGTDYNLSNGILINVSAGYDVPIFTEGAQPTFELTPAVKKQMRLFFDVLYRFFPGIPILTADGFQEKGITFDSYVLSTFGKKNPNVKLKTNTEDALTRKEVVEARYE